MSPNSRLDTGHSMKTKIWHLTLTQDDTWDFPPLFHLRSKKLTLPMVKTGTIVIKIKSRIKWKVSTLGTKYFW